jgi:hypothetical protein
MGDEKPTEEGKKRYPPDGVYDGHDVCTCLPECPADCNGLKPSRCGCAACWAAYCDATEYD